MSDGQGLGSGPLHAVPGRSLRCGGYWGGPHPRLWPVTFQPGPRELLGAGGAQTDTKGGKGPSGVQVPLD